MDDRYDDYGNSPVIASNGVKGCSCSGSDLYDTYQPTPAEKGRLTKAYIRVKTRLHRQITSVIELIFADSGMDVILSNTSGWDGTLLGWLMEATLKVRDRNLTIPADTSLEAHSSTQTLLTVLISPDHGRDLCLIKDGQLFGRRVEGVCLLFSYLYDHLKKFDDVAIDEYTALKTAEEWLNTSMVKAHMRELIKRYLRAVGTHQR
jgi:hypothetical protein